MPSTVTELPLVHMCQASSIALSNFPPHLKIIVKLNYEINSYRFENTVSIGSNARSVGPEVGISGDEVGGDAGAGGGRSKKGGGKFHFWKSYYFLLDFSMEEQGKALIL